MPATTLSFSCAAWLAELVPDPAKRQLAGLRFRHFDEIREGLDRAVVGDDDRVRRVVKPIDRRDVLGLVLHLAFERLQHDVRQVDADDGVAVRRQAVHLRPHEAAARTGFVLDDGLDARTFLFQHELLVARGNVGFAARGERLIVVEIFVEARLGRSGGGRRGKGQQGDSDSCDIHFSSGPIRVEDSRILAPAPTISARGRKRNAAPERLQFPHGATQSKTRTLRRGNADRRGKRRTQQARALRARPREHGGARLSSAARALQARDGGAVRSRRRRHARRTEGAKTAHRFQPDRVGRWRPQARPRDRGAARHHEVPLYGDRARRPAGVPRQGVVQAPRRRRGSRRAVLVHAAARATASKTPACRIRSSSNRSSATAPTRSARIRWCARSANSSRG